MPLRTLDDVLMLYRERGADQYDGEPVTHLEHALQAAHLAEQAGSDDAIVTACLLHDVGHLVSGRPGTPTLDGVDDSHEKLGAKVLRSLFGATVTEPIRWHVDAKRYLCRVDPRYHARLSDDSRRSLVLQGGIFSVGQAESFIARRGAREAVSVRLWDDLAKLPGLRTPTLDHFVQRASRCLLAGARIAAA
jgi:phosphonate degradation associated HDIG domain protein